MQKLTIITSLTMMFVRVTLAQDLFTDKDEFTRQDHLRGSITPERAWWDVQHYHLSLEVFPKAKRITGFNLISFKVLKAGTRMQIDLQQPLVITRITHEDMELPFEREGNVFWVTFPAELAPHSDHQVLIAYEGRPVESLRPPWSGGLTWQKDVNGNDFIATTCQGAGASIWWPNKDHCYEEPDRGMNISITVPDSLTAVSNGRLLKTEDHTDRNRKTFHWQVVNPINNYAVNMNVGKYVHFSETIKAEDGPLDMDYWVLEDQRQKAEQHFREAPRMIAALEHWFGPYPFYEDGYKLVVVPYLGMEHQSSVTYGNRFQNGYKGRDLSGTGVGLKFDFIIVHESGHEWFGNSITAKDIADMWIQEGFTNYGESRFVNYHFSRKEADDYVIGLRRLVKNDRNIIGTYDVNKSGSGDMYYKAANMIHMIGQLVDDDEKWRSILRSLCAKFRHQTVTTKQIEGFLAMETGLDLSCVFDQYLRTTRIPILKYRVDGQKLSLRFDNVVEGFRLPTKLTIDGQVKWVTPADTTLKVTLATTPSKVMLDRNFYFDLVEEQTDGTSN